MKCRVCKYKKMAQETERHPNGITIYFADALREKAIHGSVCTEHMTALRDVDMAAANKALSAVKAKGYVPIENIWHTPVWVPRGDRL